jgi:small subunit ribosomal protein S8
MPIPTDSIANLLTKIRNASRARKELVVDQFSNLKESLAKILAEKGFIKTVHIDKESGFPLLVIELDPSKPKLSLKRISKPGQRIYTPAKNVKRVRNGIGIGIYSTPKGILTDSQARKEKIGGEYLCEIY